MMERDHGQANQLHGINWGALDHYHFDIMYMHVHVYCTCTVVCTCLNVSTVYNDMHVCNIHYVSAHCALH